MSIAPRVAAAFLAISAVGLLAQAPAPRPRFDVFEVATIKPAVPEEKSGLFITMQGSNRFLVKNCSLKLLIAAA